MHLINKLIIGSLATVATTLAPHAVAGNSGFILYGPVNAVPTMSGGLLIVLALLMAAVAFRLLRAQAHTGTHLLVWAIAAGALATGASGVKLAADAHAAALFDVELTSASGGSQPVNEGFSNIKNATGVKLQILELQPATDCSFDTFNGGAANAGGYMEPCSDSPSTVLRPGASCDVNVVCVSE